MANPDWGSVDVELLWLTEVSYADGVDSPAGDNRVSARAISNACAAQDGNTPNVVGASDYLWQLGSLLTMTLISPNRLILQRHSTLMCPLAIPASIRPALALN